MKPVRTNELLRFFFYAGGRISRQEYALGVAFVYAANAALIAFAVHQANSDLALGLAIMVSAFPSTVAMFVLAAKRCHDMGLAGTFALLLVVPLVGLFWLIGIGLVPGDSAPNAYGPPPLFDPL